MARVLESGVLLAVKTPLEVVTVQGTRSVWFEPRKKRLVCPHGWGQYHLSSWNGPRAADFPKPNWTTCDCKSATGLCARKKLREEVLASDARAPSYYETLIKATIGVTGLRPGLVGARVPGETVLVEEVVNGWARIRNDGRIPRHAGPLWMLIDGTSLGIGPLLRPAPPRAPTETGGEESDDDDETGDFGG